MIETGDLQFVVYVPDGEMSLFVRRSIYEAFAEEVAMMGFEVPETRVVDHKWASHILAGNGSWG